MARQSVHSPSAAQNITLIEDVSFDISDKIAVSDAGIESPPGELKLSRFTVKISQEALAADFTRCMLNNAVAAQQTELGQALSAKGMIITELSTTGTSISGRLPCHSDVSSEYRCNTDLASIEAWDMIKMAMVSFPDY